MNGWVGEGGEGWGNERSLIKTVIIGGWEIMAEGGGADLNRLSPLPSPPPPPPLPTPHANALAK